MDRRQRRGRRPLFPDLQSGHPGPALRPERRLSAPVAARTGRSCRMPAFMRPGRRRRRNCTRPACGWAKPIPGPSWTMPPRGGVPSRLSIRSRSAAHDGTRTTPHRLVAARGSRGLGAAWLLSRRHDVGLYEAEPRSGGHGNTVEIDDAAPPAGGYRLHRLQRNQLPQPDPHCSIALAVPTKAFGYVLLGLPRRWTASNMPAAARRKGCSPSPPISCGRASSGCCATSCGSTATPPRPRRRCPGRLRLRRHLRCIGYGDGFAHDHLLPMAAAIWSCGAEDAATSRPKAWCAFFDNHGLLNRLRDRPQWRSVSWRQPGVCPAQARRRLRRRAAADTSGDWHCGAPLPGWFAQPQRWARREP